MARRLAITMLTAGTVLTALWFGRCATIYCPPEWITNAIVDHAPRWPQCGQPALAHESPVERAD